jgi:hypothetical protein
MFLKVIVFLIIIYWVLKLVGQIFLPLFITHRLQKMETDKQKAYRDYIARKKKEEGKVTIDGKTKNLNSKDSNNGEYVDFEEVK